MVILFITSFVSLFWIRRWLANQIVRCVQWLGGDKKVAIWVYAVLTLPGVLLHEIAHFLTAALCGLRTGAITMLPIIYPDGGVELGSVQVEKCDPFRQSLVGIAPLFFSLPMIIWLSVQLFPRPNLWYEWNQLLTNWFWLKSYLLTTIALHMFPSQKDMTAWPIVAVLSAVFTGAAMIVGIKLPSFYPIVTHLSLFIHQSVLGMVTAIALSCTLLLLIDSFLFVVKHIPLRVK